MEKTYKKIEELKEWDKNPRSITKDGFERLKKQITKLGVYKPLLITKDGIVLGGNMRLKALQELGYKDIWVSVVDAPTEEKKIEYALSDNDRVGKYEGDQLADLIGNFPQVEWNDYAVDIKEPQLVSDIIDQYSEVVEDEVPEVPKVAESKLSEVYTLGRHRLMCGDATKIEDVTKLMDGKKADLLLTDPPYGQLKIFRDKSKDMVGVDSFYGRNIKARHYHGNYQSEGDFKIEPVIEVIDKLGIDKRVIWGGNFFECLPIVNSWLCWDKTGGNRNIKTPWSDFELAWTTLGIPMRIFHFLWKGMMREGKAIERVHPTEKPIQLSAWILKDFCPDDINILDLFGGSGSTLIVCEQTNRTCYMMEIDPLYCDVIRKRYKNYIDNYKNKV